MTLETVETPNDAYEKNVLTPDARTKHAPVTSSRQCCSPLAVAKTLILTGVLLIALSVVYSTVLSTVIDKKIRSGVVVCSAADAGADYYDPYGDCDDCTPFYYTIRLFNVTNADAHLATGAKLALHESGEYVYRRRQLKVDVTFADNRVTYKQYTYHTFEPSRSCPGCSDTDVFVGLDVAYLNVLASTGGESAFLFGLVNGTFGKGKSDEEVATIVRTNGTQMMKWINGLNSLDPLAMQTVGSSVAPFLLSGVDAIVDLKLDGFAFNGLFIRRSIRQWALGYPSLLAGLGLGSAYVGDCTTGPNILQQCTSCSGDACLAIAAACKQCLLAQSVVRVNDITCSAVEAVMTAAYGATEGKAFASSTCGLCAAVGLCAAPIPGIAEDSGMDYSQVPPPSAALLPYVQRTGCDDLSAIGAYEVYNGETTTALWTTAIKAKRNPTLAELSAFATYANCAAPSASLRCSTVEGADGQSLLPGGASFSGLADTIDQQTATMYLSQAKQSINLLNTHEEVTYESITLHRFTPPIDLLTATTANAAKGTGFPVDGVQPVGFPTGFLAYVSYPLFLYGDATLLDAISVTLDGSNRLNPVTHASLYDSPNKLTQAMYDKYMTFMDVEAGTGKTMRARKRLQASYAVSPTMRNASIAMTDVLWPTLPTEVIIPAYWAEESATIGQTSIDAYKSVAMLLQTLVPVLIAGSVVGLALVVLGVLRRRRARARYNALTNTDDVI